MTRRFLFGLVAGLFSAVLRLKSNERPIKTAFCIGRASAVVNDIHKFMCVSNDRQFRFSALTVFNGRKCKFTSVWCHEKDHDERGRSLYSTYLQAGVDGGD